MSETSPCGSSGHMYCNWARGGARDAVRIGIDSEGTAYPIDDAGQVIDMSDMPDLHADSWRIQLTDEEPQR